MKKRILACLLSVLMLVSLIPVSAFAAENDTWDGTADTSWYNDSAAVFTITTPEQLAGLAQLVDGGNTFAGKTVKLGADIDLYAAGDDEPISFNPAGSYAFNKTFNGVFDGQGYTISNMYQSGWALGNGLWDGDDCGLGLFGKVQDATIKNLNIDGSNLPSEANLIGAIAGAAYGECVFENITVTNTYIGNHSYYSGGIVGWASGNHKYINCDLDASNTISSQWGDFNNVNGGIIGGAGSSGTYYFKDCDVAVVIDAFNDYTSAYEWGNYRNCGMLIGQTGHTVDDNPVTTVAAPNVTAENCRVIYDDWANYTYCQFNAMNYPYVRVQAGASTHAYGNARYDYATDANGNKVTDTNHVHNTGEDHERLFMFDQLFGGPAGHRYCEYGLASHPGVTVHRISSAGMEHDNTGHWYACTEKHNGEACTEKIYYKAHTPEVTMAYNETAHWNVCTDCGTPYGYAAHVGGDWIVDSDAEIGVEGAQHKECTICGYSPVETEVIPAKEEPVDYVLFALAARYAQRFDVHVSAENATVTGDLVIKYKRNGTVNIDVADGYQIVDVIANGQSLGVVDTVTFKRVITDQTLVVVTEPIPAEETPAANP